MSIYGIESGMGDGSMEIGSIKVRSTFGQQRLQDRPSRVAVGGRGEGDEKGIEDPLTEAPTKGREERVRRENEKREERREKREERMREERMRREKRDL